LLINDWIATVIGTYVYKLLHRQTIHTFVSLDGISTRSLIVCRDELLAYLESRSCVNSNVTVEKPIFPAEM